LKLEKWALIAEIAAGVGVLITLIFLVIGIRDNTNVTRAASYEDLMSDLNQVFLTVVDDPELSQLWARRGERNFESLSNGEFERLALLNRATWRIYDAAYYSFRNGSLGLAQWQRFAEVVCGQRPMEDELWSRTSFAVSAEFVAYVDTSCQE